ncbi:coagulation factor V [Periophthalmus magnuspinnatus]|uniref:coagulation factor V n=1 Tax=Periophthalmus magnuspinnatus TaxID=409849 RepID=UPI00145BE09F|nr:coagulation factor V [Periophthalmus magnuspinnatus]
MRLCGVLVLVLTTVLCVPALQRSPRERRYYIAAVEIDWNYSGTKGLGQTYKKVVFREYEAGFTRAKAHPSWLGLMGPTLRAEEGETIVVTFKNMAAGEYSIHPHGIAYGKQSEGAYYFDNTSQNEKRDDVIRPNEEHVYYWEVTAEVSPQRNDPSCLTYSYVSHRTVVEDYNSGLIGALLICKHGTLDPSGQQIGIHHELVFLFGVFKERESKYTPKYKSKDDDDEHIKYTINGYTDGTLPDVRVCAHTSVSLHFLGMSSDPEVFSVHMNGQVLQQDGHKVSSVGLVSGTCATASMTAVHPGRWLLSSHTFKHMEAGMHGFFEVKNCPGFNAPQRTLTIAQKRQSRVWTYYIAAEEVVWDYAPDMPVHTDEGFKLKYLTNSPVRIGQKYKKAVFTLYKNESFTEKAENQQRKNELGILGPVIRAQIRDVVKIVFKNMASRPYSIYPHGLTIEKSQEGVNYPAGGNQSHGVQPGETHTYQWHVIEEDEPLNEDSRCLTRMYHSAVDTPRDIASGLIGPMLICKSESLNVRNVQLKADKEQHAVFAVFDENKSWYLDENINRNCDQFRVNKDDPEFYKSNVMHTINGYTFESGPDLGFCNGEVATWHVSSVGAQDFIQTATFYGHPFELNDRTEDMLSLYPMTGETISMNMDNIGVWLLASLNTHESTKGVRVKFNDVECFRDYQYEYEDEDKVTNEWKEWKPATLEEIQKEQEEKEKEEEKKEKEKPIEVDDYTEGIAAEWGLRSLKNQSTDMELLDLSFLDSDASNGYDDTLSKNGKTVEEKVEVNTSSSNAGILSTGNKSLETDSSNLTVFDNNETRPLITATVTDSSDPSSSDVRKLYMVNMTFVSDFVADSSEEIFSRGDVFVYDVPQNITSNSPKDSSDHSVKNGSTASDNATEIVIQSADLNMTSTGNISNDSTRGQQHLLNDTESAIASELLKDTIENITSPNDLFGPMGNIINSSVDLDSLTNHTTLKNQTGNFSLDAVTLVNGSVALETAEEDAKNNTGLFEPTLNATDLQNTSTFLKTAFENATNQTSSETALSNFTGLTATTLDNVTDLNTFVNASNSTESIETHNKLTEIQNTTDFFQINTSTEANSDKTLTYDSATIVENVSNETKSSNSYIVDNFEEVGASVSSEEIVIYLQENITEAIKTKPLKNPAQNWTYDTKHETVPMEIPDHIVKYIGKPDPPKKPVKKVTMRHWPNRGQGMKTKKRKDYIPQARSGLPFSPRGFNPGMSPRGSRPLPPKPVSDEDDLINNPIVIGVPRPDFSDYELYIPGDEPDHLDLDERKNVREEEYEYVSYKDPYSSDENMKHFSLDDATKYYLKNVGKNTKIYFIAAEEVEWDYAGYGHRRQERSQLNSRETKFKKVIFREYLDSTFTTPDIRGEIDEHLGILGPLIKAEVGQDIMVMFKNNASRPYSLHPNGVAYTKQTEGLNYEDGSKYWHKYDNEVQPNKTYTYLWTVNSAVGPAEGESDCRTWAYYSGVNPERDIQSGLIGPLLVCREGTLNKSLTNTREFMLLFMTFDESQSWYFEENVQKIQRKMRYKSSIVALKENLQFHTINGIIHSLKGLRMYTNQLVRWHLINMGSPKDFQSVHFHGQSFFHKKIRSYKQAVYPLLPGGFATLEMIPSKPGLWQLETEIGSIQQKGMQTLFLVLDDVCYHPFGLESGSVTDVQMTAKNSRGYWKPHLARLNNAGKYNAWSTDANNSWIQVDFQRPVVISQIATQGAKQMFYSQYVLKYAISYSNDRRRWTFYKGDSKSFRKIFPGNQEAYVTKTNTFFPPIIGRFIRLHPVEWYGSATLRMEYYGCELDGCSVPLGMENRQIQNSHITASSTASSWYGGPWKPYYARLNKQGTINAWQARTNNLEQWLQVELPHTKKITGIVTQGAKSLGKEMYVISFSLQFSNDGLHWTDYTDDEVITSKTFIANTNNSDHVRNYIHPPIFSRFIRIMPKSWKNAITLRIELLGCDSE